MSKEIDLDTVMVSEDIAMAWFKLAEMEAEKLQARGYAGTIPDEQAVLNEDGTLTIFVNIPEFKKISIEVPEEHWQWRQ